MALRKLTNIDELREKGVDMDKPKTSKQGPKSGGVRQPAQRGKGRIPWHPPRSPSRKRGKEKEGKKFPLTTEILKECYRK